MRDENNNESRLNLLDSVVVALGATTLALFLFWAAGHILGIGIFEDVPAYLQSASKHLFAVITGGALSSSLLLIVRRQVSGRIPPNYLIWVAASTTFLIVAIFGLTYGIKQIKSEKTSKNLRNYQIERKITADSERAVYLIKGNFFKSSPDSTLKIEMQSPFLSDSIPEERVSFVMNSEDAGFVLEPNFKILGVCANVDSNKISILGSSWVGAARVPASVDAYNYNEHRRRFDKVEIIDGIELESLEADGIVTCAQGEGMGELEYHDKSSYNVKINAVACTCSFDSFAQGGKIVARSFEKSLDLGDVNIHEFPEEVDSNTRIAAPYYKYKYKDTLIQKFVDDVNALADSSMFHIIKLQSDDFEVISLSYLGDDYGSWNYVLYRRRNVTEWRLLYIGLGTSYGPHGSRLCQLSKKGVLLANICTNDCIFYGNNRVVSINLNTSTLSFPSNQESCSAVYESD